MSPLDRIKAQHSTPGPLDVKVPEWGDGPGKPLVIRYRKLNLIDVDAAAQAAPNSTVRQNVELFCILAQNEDGSQMFKRIDALELMEHADPAVLGRVMREMGIIRTADPEAIEKN